MYVVYVGRNIETAQFGPGNDMAKLFARKPGGIPSQEFMADEDERALQLLLSQERVVTLVYRKAFPLTNKAKTKLLSSMDGYSTVEHRAGLVGVTGGLSLPVVSGGGGQTGGLSDEANGHNSPDKDKVLLSGGGGGGGTTGAAASGSMDTVSLPNVHSRNGGK